MNVRCFGGDVMSRDGGLLAVVIGFSILLLPPSFCDIEVRTIISNSSDSDQVECIIPVAEDRVQLNLSCKVDVSGEQVEILHSPGNNESTEFHLVGQCVADVCTSAAPNVYNVTYKTGFGLEMTTVHSVERHTVGGVWMCRVRNPVSSENDFYKIAKCRIEVIHVPQPSDIVCDVKLRTTDWVVEGWCTVAKIYSFYKMYKCSWHRTNGAEWLIPSENISFSMKSYIDPQNKREYNSGNCSFKHSLTPFVDASYKYHAIFQPGEVLAEAQTLKIEAPSLPVVRCKAGEGLNCTCETSNIGEPKGTLLWKAGLDVLARGEPGQSFLRLGLQDLSIFESDETEVTCELLWAKSFVTRHRIVPDGKPYIRNFTMNGLSGELVTTEKSFVTFECSASGKPAPRVRILKGAYPYPTSGQTELDALQKNTAVIFTLSDVSCTDSSIYTCVARNDEGFEYIRHARLRVECAPHLITQTSKSTFREPLQLLYNPPKGHSLRLNLLAYPFLSGWELSLAGQKKATRNSDRLNVSCLHADKDNNNKLVCFITARGIKQEDTGMHVLRLSNSRGVLDVPFLVKIRRPETIAGRTMTAAFIVMTCLLTAIAFAIIAIVLQTKRLSQGGSPNTNGPIYKGNLNQTYGPLSPAGKIQPIRLCVKYANETTKEKMFAQKEVGGNNVSSASQDTRGVASGRRVEGTVTLTVPRGTNLSYMHENSQGTAGQVTKQQNNPNFMHVQQNILCEPHEDVTGDGKAKKLLFKSNNVTMAVSMETSKHIPSKTSSPAQQSLQSTKSSTYESMVLLDEKSGTEKSQMLPEKLESRQSRQDSSSFSWTKESPKQSILSNLYRQEEQKAEKAGRNVQERSVQEQKFSQVSEKVYEAGSSLRNNNRSARRSTVTRTLRSSTSDVISSQKSTPDSSTTRLPDSRSDSPRSLNVRSQDSICLDPVYVRQPEELRILAITNSARSHSDSTQGPKDNLLQDVDGSVLSGASSSSSCRSLGDRELMGSTTSNVTPGGVSHDASAEVPQGCFASKTMESTAEGKDQSCASVPIAFPKKPPEDVGTTQGVAEAESLSRLLARDEQTQRWMSKQQKSFSRKAAKIPHLSNSSNQELVGREVFPRVANFVSVTPDMVKKNPLHKDLMNEFRLTVRNKNLGQTSLDQFAVSPNQPHDRKTVTNKKASSQRNAYQEQGEQFVGARSVDTKGDPHFLEHNTSGAEASEASSQMSSAENKEFFQQKRQRRWLKKSNEESTYELTSCHWRESLASRPTMENYLNSENPHTSEISDPKDRTRSKVKDLLKGLQRITKGYASLSKSRKSFYKVELVPQNKAEYSENTTKHRASKILKLSPAFDEYPNPIADDGQSPRTLSPVYGNTSEPIEQVRPIKNFRGKLHSRFLNTNFSRENRNQSNPKDITQYESAASNPRINEYIVCSTGTTKPEDVHSTVAGSDDEHTHRVAKPASVIHPYLCLPDTDAGKVQATGASPCVQQPLANDFPARTDKIHLKQPAASTRPPSESQTTKPCLAGDSAVKPQRQLCTSSNNVINDNSLTTQSQPSMSSPSPRTRRQWTAGSPFPVNCALCSPSHCQVMRPTSSSEPSVNSELSATQTSHPSPDGWMDQN